MFGPVVAAVMNDPIHPKLRDSQKMFINNRNIVGVIDVAVIDFHRHFGGEFSSNASGHFKPADRATH